MTQQTKALTIKEYISQPNVKARVSELLKSRASQFMITVNSIVSNDKKLQVCEPASLVTAALTLTALDLPMNSNLGLAYIIPYKDRKTGLTLAQAQLGWKSFVQLALRTKKFRRINTSDVRKGEFAGIDRLSGDIDFNWMADEMKRSKLPVVGYVAYFRLNGGFEKSLYMSVEELKAHATKYSAEFRKYGTGMWKDRFEDMARKTVIKLLLSKYGLLSTDMAKAQEVDQAVVVDEDTTYIDNPKETAHDISEEKERQRLLKYIAGAKTLEELEQAKTSCVDDETVEAYTEKEKQLKTKAQEQVEPFKNPSAGEADGPSTGSEEIEEVDIDAISEEMEAKSGQEPTAQN